jgi:hypothetical protein
VEKTNFAMSGLLFSPSPHLALSHTRAFEDTTLRHELISTGISFCKAFPPESREAYNPGNLLDLVAPQMGKVPKLCSQVLFRKDKY